MLNNKTRVAKAEVIEGTGTVATSTIQSGEIIWQPEEKYPLVSPPELARLHQQGSTDVYSQVDVDLFAINKSKEWLMNHSCESNCVLRNRMLVADRLIMAGEEISYDYGLTEIYYRWSFWCECGSQDCRGMVSNLNYLDSRLIKKRSGKVPEHALIAASRASNIEVIKYHLQRALYRLKRRIYGDRPVPQGFKWFANWISKLVR